MAVLNSLAELFSDGKNTLDKHTQGNFPAYVYDLDGLESRYDKLLESYEHKFDISYAVKSNPNIKVLNTLCKKGALIDASSYAEIERARQAGFKAEDISFTGPGKRYSEIYNAITTGIGALIIESPLQAKLSNQAAENLNCVQPVILRINPLKSPRAFGAKMSGSASQFGIDELEAPSLIDEIGKLNHLRIIGFHIYSGSNCLDAAAIIENYKICSEVFIDLTRHLGKPVSRLIFGSGLGIPYHEGQKHVDIELAGREAAKVLSQLRNEPLLSNTKCSIELGRWLIGPAGYLLTSVIDKKHSRNTEILICDAGFNTHMAACGMLGSVLRKNWPIENLSAANRDSTPNPYMIVGPLCTSIDLLSREMQLPETKIGDILCIRMSGAYGLTASPTRFISHPEAKEFTLRNGALQEVTESHLNTYPYQLEVKA